MAKQVCYCLKARSPFHLGERGVGMEETSIVLHADTLFSALCLTLLELGEDLPSLLNLYPRWRFEEGKTPQALPGTPPFRLSSAFPFWTKIDGGKTTERIHFFPKPFIPIHIKTGTDNPQQAKTLKKIRFVSKAVFEWLLSAQEMDFDTDLLAQEGNIWLTQEEKEVIGEASIWKEETQPRVTVDRISSGSQVYAVGQVRFAEGAGLFFLVDYAEETWQPIIEKALRALGDSGVGGERSGGRGQFDLEVVNDFNLITPRAGDAYTSLSLYWPAKQEVEKGILDDASYGFLDRRGWIGARGGMNLRRRGVRMLTEGSVFPLKPEGALVDVKPLDPIEVHNVPHDVWRYGLAFPVSCQRTRM